MVERPKLVETPTQESPRKSTALEDAQLVKRVQCGEVEAFGELVRRHADGVYNAVWRICGNLEDARDLTQDAFAKGFESIGRFRGESSFYTWIFRVAINLALSHLRKAKGRRVISLDSMGATEGTQAESLAAQVRDARSDSARSAVDDAELRGHVVRAIHALDADQRAVVVLRDIEGCDYREIGEILGIAAGTVKSRLHRARAALREALLPYVRQER
ncbi:MAG: sigma-70 family RNA polymerase sigma factor [Planctomycetes bacterium]|nr:sigma-70 family RNA polymerase sigma factor [Planctomycetota bacterium]